MEMSPAELLDQVRARYPLALGEDADGLRAHAEHIAALRSALDSSPWRDAEPAMTFDPRRGTP